MSNYSTPIQTQTYNVGPGSCPDQPHVLAQYSQPSSNYNDLFNNDDLFDPDSDKEYFESIGYGIHKNDDNAADTTHPPPVETILPPAPETISTIPGLEAAPQDDPNCAKAFFEMQGNSLNAIFAMAIGLLDDNNKLMGEIEDDEFLSK